MQTGSATAMTVMFSITAVPPETSASVPIPMRFCPAHGLQAKESTPAMHTPASSQAGYASPRFSPMSSKMEYRMPEIRKTVGTPSTRKLISRVPTSTLAVKIHGCPAKIFRLRNHFAMTALMPLLSQ